MMELMKKRAKLWNRPKNTLRINSWIFYVEKQTPNNQQLLHLKINNASLKLDFQELLENM